MVLELISLLFACILLYLVSWLLCVAMWRSRRIVRHPSPSNDTQVTNDGHGGSAHGISGHSGSEPKHLVPGRFAGSGIHSPA
jgi:hypothetical protein